MEEEIDNLRRIPMSLNDGDFNRVLELANKNKQFSQDDIIILENIIQNAQFWKNKYIEIQKDVWKVAGRHNIRI